MAASAMEWKGMDVLSVHQFDNAGLT